MVSDQETGTDPGPSRGHHWAGTALSSRLWGCPLRVPCGGVGTEPVCTYIIRCRVFQVERPCLPTMMSEDTAIHIATLQQFSVCALIYQFAALQHQYFICPAYL